MYDINALRSNEFPHSEHHVYFNHAAISPLPARTARMMAWVLEELAKNPIAFFRHEYHPRLERLKREVAALLNAASPSEVVPITSTTAGLAAVAHALEWQTGDNVIYFEQEYPANAFPWMSLASYGVESRIVPAENGGLTVDSLARVADGRTRLVAASTLQFFTGHRTDVAAIGAFCRERGILFVVDAIQSIGHIPLDVQAMHVDVVASGGQKSILGAPGAGVLYVRAPLCAQMQPLVLGPTAVENPFHFLAHNQAPLPGAARFNMGTDNLLGVMGLVESVCLLRELGVANIDRHTTALAAEAIQCLVERGYRVVTPLAEHGSIVTFDPELSLEEADELLTFLEQRDVTVARHQDKPGKAHLRLSFHCYNTRQELDRFFQVLAEHPSTAG